MKLYFAAAFVLLAVAGCASLTNPAASGGWLLLVPPLNQAGYAATDEPLAKWQTVGRFWSQIDCTSSMQTQQNFVLGQFGAISNAQNFNQLDAVKILKGQCVPSDDPRLKEK